MRHDNAVILRGDDDARIGDTLEVDPMTGEARVYKGDRAPDPTKRYGIVGHGVRAGTVTTVEWLGALPPYSAPAAAKDPVQQATEALAGLTAEQRVEAMLRFCSHCGRDQSQTIRGCQCRNDE